MNGDTFGQGENLGDFAADGFQLLVAAEYDIPFLEITGYLQNTEYINTLGAVGIVPAGTPAVLAAAYRAVADVHHILDRAPDHTFGAGIGAAAGGHHAGAGFGVGFQRALAGFNGRRFCNFIVFGAVLGSLFGKCLKHFLHDFLARLYGQFVHSCTHQYASPLLCGSFRGGPFSAWPSPGLPSLFIGLQLLFLPASSERFLHLPPHRSR
ncbi:hypothetical protein D3C75_810900 [compost metagenome]